MDRMYCYIWSEATNPNECKFGERWVKEGLDPKTDCLKRIKESLGVRKDLFNAGVVQLNWFGDVHEYAEKVGRAYMHGRVDDEIRNHIGFRKGTTGEVHELPADEMIARVSKVLAKAGAPLPVVGLAAWQYNAAENVLTAISEGKRTIVAELCARFGKTIWGGVLARETEADITIIASYVQTVMSSFKKDLSQYDQFRDFVVVDMKDDDYQDQVKAARADGQQVIALISMCKGGKRQERIDFLFGCEGSKLVLIDEADFGAHRDGQTAPFKNARKADDVVILMTGTNGDRAAATWDVDHYLSVVYPELIMEKNAVAI